MHVQVCACVCVCVRVCAELGKLLYERNILHITSYFYKGVIRVTILRKIDHLCASTEIHFLSEHESYTHALSRYTKYLTNDHKIMAKSAFTDGF